MRSRHVLIFLWTFLLCHFEKIDALICLSLNVEKLAIFLKEYFYSCNVIKCISRLHRVRTPTAPSAIKAVKHYKMIFYSLDAFRDFIWKRALMPCSRFNLLLFILSRLPFHCRTFYDRSNTKSFNIFLWCFHLDVCIRFLELLIKRRFFKFFLINVHIKQKIKIKGFWKYGNNT